jgi:hypothetical protein
MNDLASGKVDASVAGRLGYLANILIKAMETNFEQATILALQQRLDSLEDRLGDI